MEIQRLQWDNPEVAAKIKQGKPVILLGCPLSAPNSNRWTFDFLKTILPERFKCEVFCSESLRFKYWDDSKNSNGYKYTPPTTRMRMTFSEFLDLMNERNKPSSSTAGESSNDESSEEKQKYYYLQQMMVQEMGQKVMEEYLRFPLEVAVKFKVMGAWDEFTTNLLLCGPEGAITPVHYDEQENLFAQLWGVKRVRLFPPEAWARLYPYPLGHPSDRQAQVKLPERPGSLDLDTTEEQLRFPAFHNSDPAVAEMVAELQPGELLFVPQYWFHQMEAVTDNVSLSWWYKHQSRGRDSGPIDPKGVSLVAVRRNMERVIGEMAGGGQKAHQFFLSLASGRLPFPELPEASQMHGGGMSVGVSFTPRFHRSISGSSALPYLEQDMAAGDPIDVPSSWEGVAVQALNLIAMILESGRSRQFLFELVTGRFNGF